MADVCVFINLLNPLNLREVKNILKLHIRFKLV